MFNLTLNACVTSCDLDTVRNSVNKKCKLLMRCVNAPGGVRMSDPIERAQKNRRRNASEPLAEKSNRQRDWN